ncbi:MAG: hypothetical protein WCS85_02915 [Candidatus Peribacteraceae bacterium]
MDEEEIQKRCEAFLRELGRPGFIVFGWPKNEDEFGVTYSAHEIPPQVVIKGLISVLSDYTTKTL